MSENFGDRKLNMATSGTILSLSARRPSRKPSDGGGGTSEQRVRRESDAAAPANCAPACRSRDRPPHARSLPASANPFSSTRPSPSPPAKTPFQRPPISLVARGRARDRIPRYRCCPAYGTCAKGVTRLTARPENIRSSECKRRCVTRRMYVHTYIQSTQSRPACAGPALRMIMKDRIQTLLAVKFVFRHLHLITLRNQRVYLHIK